VIVDGPFDGLIKGDLVVVGSGDPSIGGRGGSDVAVFVDALKAQGIRRIEGRIIGDDDAVEEPRPQLAWAWDDLGYTSGAIFGALNMSENRMAVTIVPGAAAGLPTTLSVEPHAVSRPLANRTVTVAPGGMQMLWPEQRPGEPFLTIAGFIPMGAAPARLNVAVGNPTVWFAAVLRNALLRAGIEVTGEAFDIDDVVPAPNRDAARALFTYKSPPLSAIAQPMLKDSINLYAEAALRLNAAAGAFPTNDAALEGLNMRLTSWGVPPDAQQLIDGSGLSRRNVISPDALLTVLRRMHDPAGASPFVGALPIAGVDGSLANRMRGSPAAGNVRAKTGTMSNIRSLAGYVTTRDGEHLAFAIIVNNFEGSGAEANQALDAIAMRLASFTRAAPAPSLSARPTSR
jgi:D-alanyl-D-alanine carboxypeptidase/D-alanyl-D-alanine-endopeptidase (penicillin-binding protein 4)